VDHVWRVFDETGKEWLCKQITMNVFCVGEKEPNSEDWNIVAHGEMKIDRERSMISIV
jgi:hypothetical protein